MALHCYWEVKVMVEMESTCIVSCKVRYICSRNGFYSVIGGILESRDASVELTQSHVHPLVFNSLWFPQFNWYH